MDWFLYDIALRYERVNSKIATISSLKTITVKDTLSFSKLIG